MNTYIINLARSVDRKNEMLRQLRKLNLKYQFIEAVDAATMTDQEFQRLAQYSTKRKGEVACTLSHVRAYKEVVRSNSEYGLILEDDCLIDPDLPQLLYGIEEYLHPRYITLLTYFWCREGSLRLRRVINKGKYKFCHPYEIWGVARSGAYIISREAAMNIIAYHAGVAKCNADNWVVYQKEKLIDGVSCVYPMMIKENPMFGSEIEYVPSGIAKLVKAAISRVPILSKIAAMRRERIAQRFKNIEIDK